MKPLKTTTLALLTLTCIGIFFSGCASPQPRTSAAPYPLKKCLVSENELGSMGDVVTEVYNGREVKFCCKPCVKKFHANPEKYLARLK